MFEGEVARRVREDLHGGVVALLAFMIAATIWGLATPVFTVWGPVTDGVPLVWIDANESPIDAWAVLATAPVSTLAWTLLVGRRVPWPIGPRPARLAFRKALLVVPGVIGFVLAFTVSYLPSGEVWVAPGAWVTFGQVPAIQAARAIVLAAGVGLALIVSMPAMAAVLRRLDPSRPVIWLADRARSPHTAPARPEPVA